MDAPELKWPTTATTLESTSFCATVVALVGLASSSSASSRTHFLAADFDAGRIRVSTASCTPLRISMPMWACGPVKPAMRSM